MGTDGPNGGKFTSAEALLQLDEAAVVALQEAGFEVAIETNGTKLPPEGLGGSAQ